MPTNSSTTSALCALTWDRLKDAMLRRTYSGSVVRLNGPRSEPQSFVHAQVVLLLPLSLYTPRGVPYIFRCVFAAALRRFSRTFRASFGRNGCKNLVFVGLPEKRNRKPATDAATARPPCPPSHTCFWTSHGSPPLAPPLRPAHDTHTAATCSVYTPQPPPRQCGGGHCRLLSRSAVQCAPTGLGPRPPFRRTGAFPGRCGWPFEVLTGLCVIVRSFGRFRAERRFEACPTHCWYEEWWG